MKRTEGGAEMIDSFIHIQVPVHGYLVPGTGWGTVETVCSSAAPKKTYKQQHLTHETFILCHHHHQGGITVLITRNT